MAEVPDSILSERAVQDEKFAVKYLMNPIKPEHAQAIFSAVRQDLTRNLGRTQPALFETMRQSLDAAWGRDATSWNEVNLFETLEDVIFRASNSILVGSPLCHEEKYLDSLFRFTTWLGAGAVIVGQYAPWFMAPILGYVASIPISIYKRKPMQLLLPVVKERMQRIRAAEKDMPSNESLDLITWTILASKDSTPDEVAELILFLVSRS